MLKQRELNFNSRTALGFNFPKIIEKKGSALLVAMLVMGVLISISLALSVLVLREIRITGDFLDAGRAYYAAESGIETALYRLDNNLPGWEPETDEDGFASIMVDEEFSAVAEYSVANKCRAYPCFDEGYDLDSANPWEFYDVLDLNESITIPLFVVDENGVEVPVGDFAVEFFSPFDPGRHLYIDTRDLNSWDVLRWKIFGIHRDYDVTETISDFTALSAVFGAGSDTPEATGPRQPSWFGTKDCDEFDGTGLRYNDDIECEGYVLGAAANNRVFGDQISEVAAGVCLHTQAREFYLYEGAGEDRRVDADGIRSCYPIKEFLRTHRLNYLSLTNLINTSLFRPEFSDFDSKNALSKLYFRVELFPDESSMSSIGVETDGQTVREFADITARGYAGDSQKSINVKLQRGSFMPVFNFSLYSTYKTPERQEGYWYEEE